MICEKQGVACKARMTGVEAEMTEEQSQRPAYIYCRYSSEMQSQGDSLRRQFQRCNEAIKKHNLYVKERITDEAFSGFHGDNLINGKLKDFIDRAIAGDIEKNAFLIVENLDRITRLQPSKAVNVITQILSSGLEIYQTSPECLFTFKNKKDEAMTIIMITLFAQRAHEESDTKSYRIKEAWISRIERILKGEQKILMDKPPYWLDVVEKDFDVNGKTKRLKCYQVNQTRTDEVLLILEYLKSMGIKESCKMMNAESAGKKWTVKGVQRLLQSKTLYGELDLKLSVREDGKKELQSRGLEMPQIYPPIIAKQDFDEILELIKVRASGRGGGRKSTQFNNIFSKILYCAHCGGAYRYMHKREYSYLVCYNSEVHTCKYEKVLSLRFYDVQNAILAYGGYFDFNVLFRGVELKEYSADIADKQADLEAKRAAFNNMFNSIMQKNNGIISSMYQSSLDMTEKSIEELEREIETLKQKDILNPSKKIKANGGALLLDPALLSTAAGRAKLNAHLKRMVERIDLSHNKVTNDGYNLLSVKFFGVETVLKIKFQGTKRIFDDGGQDFDKIFDSDSDRFIDEAEFDKSTSMLDDFF
jgi:DNA invertase Pin-like site-specific DNA recombinase